MASENRSGLGKVGFIKNYPAFSKALARLMDYSSVTQKELDDCIEEQLEDADTYIDDEGEVCARINASGRFFRTPLKSDENGKPVFVSFVRSDRDPSKWMGAQLVTEDGIIELTPSEFVIQGGGDIDDFERVLYSIVEDAPLLLAGIKQKMEARGFRWVGKPKAAIEAMKTVAVVQDKHPQPVDYVAKRSAVSDLEYLRKGWGFMVDGSGNDPIVHEKSAARPHGEACSLFEFAFVPSSRYVELAEMALPEQWTLEKEEPFGVLVKFLKYTFERAIQSPKTFGMQTGKYAIFNTGLVDCNYDWIYAWFEPNRNEGKQKWYLLGFFVMGNRGNTGLGKSVAKCVDTLPDRVSWLGRNELYFDTECEIYPDWDHIVQERIDRLPARFVRRYVNPGCEIDKLYARLENVQKNKERSFEEIDNRVRSIAEAGNMKYARYKSMPLSNWDIDRLRVDSAAPTELSKAIDSYEAASYEEMNLRSEIQTLMNSREYEEARFEMITRLDTAIELAKKKIIWDYAAAVPIYYPKGKEFGFLLPLALLDSKTVNAALVVSKVGPKAYQGQTILTREMAYSNARLLRKPDSQWISQWVN